MKSKQEVDDALALVELHGGVIVKPVQTVSWGGYSGYFKTLMDIIGKSLMQSPGNLIPKIYW